MADVTEFDVVVVGGGIAGCFAAIGASLVGGRVLLVDRGPHLGGQATTTGERQFCGDVLHVNDPFRRMLEDLQRLGSLDPIEPEKGGTRFDGVALAFVLQEHMARMGVHLLLHTTLVGADRSGGLVTGIKVFNKGGLHTFAPRFVIDCTGDADLSSFAGFPTVKGGPVHRPDGSVDQGKSLQLPMSLCFWMEDVGRRVEPRLPPSCPTWKGEDDMPMTSVDQVTPHTIFVKMKVVGGDVTDGWSHTQAELSAWRQMMGLVYHLQTKGYRGRRFDTYRLSHVAPGLGVREGRRIVGNYVLTEEDVRSGREFPDAVAVGTYQIDYHWPDVLQRAGTGITDLVPPYHIPFRCLVPRGARNLAVAGRCISGDQMAMSSFRVLTTCAQTGFAAGVSCALAMASQVDLSAVDVGRIQELLEENGQVLDREPYMAFYRARQRKRRLKSAG